MSEPNLWPPLVAFARRYGPPFPVEILPPWLGVYVSQVANAIETPVDLPALLSLAVLAAACAKKAQVVVNGKWSEPLNLYTLVCLPPSSGKSPVFRKLVRPIEVHEQTEGKRVAVEIAASNARRHRLQRELDAAEDENQAAELSQQLDQVPERFPPREVMDDVTAEKLAIAMSENGGRIALLSSEGGFFDALRGRYQNVPNLDIFLKGHSGDSCRVDRVGRSPVILNAPALTIGMTVQPHALGALLSNPAARNRGLPARFFFAVPEPTVGFRSRNTEPETDEAEQAYFQELSKLLQQPIPHEPFLLRLSPSACTLLTHYAQDLEPRLRPDEGDLAFDLLLDWAGKLVGGLARLAGQFHLAEHGFRGEVSEGTLLRALELSPYFIEHARCALGEKGDAPDERLARRVLRGIQQRRWTEFTQRDLHVALGGKICSSEELAQALELLCRRFHLRPAAPQPRSKGRPAGPAFEVNPAVHVSQNPHNPQNGAHQQPNGASGAPFVDSVGFVNRGHTTEEDQNGAPP